MWYFLKSLFFPAHNRGKALPKKIIKILKKDPGFWDLPELPEIGSPLSKTGLIAKSQKELSKRFKTKRCFFGVNGASGLIQSGIIAMAKPGEYILMPRNVHISVIKTCAMQNIIPIFFIEIYLCLLTFLLWFYKRIYFIMRIKKIL